MSEVAECSYRIIMATEIIGLSTEERQVIASAVRYNIIRKRFLDSYKVIISLNVIVVNKVTITVTFF